MELFSDRLIVGKYSPSESRTRERLKSLFRDFLGTSQDQGINSVSRIAIFVVLPYFVL